MTTLSTASSVLSTSLSYQLPIRSRGSSLPKYTLPGLWSSRGQCCGELGLPLQLLRGVTQHSDTLDPKFTIRSVKHPDFVMIWGYFSYCGTSKLVVLPKNVKINQNLYLEVLCDAYPDSFDKVRAETLIQDQAFATQLVWRPSMLKTVRWLIFRTGQAISKL